MKIFKWLFSLCARRFSQHPVDMLPEGFICPFRKAFLIKHAHPGWTRYEWIDVQTHGVIEVTYRFSSSLQGSSSIQSLRDKIHDLEKELRRIQENG